MIRYFLSGAILIVVAACSPAEQGGEPAIVAEPREEVVPEGRAAYERVCAGCHDEGVGGAPAVGDREAWADRSSLWMGVLAEHAKEGYLDMPAKGGAPDISDPEVTAAAEYMMSLTYPELPGD